MALGFDAAIMYRAMREEQAEQEKSEQRRGYEGYRVIDAQELSDVEALAMIHGHGGMKF